MITPDYYERFRCIGGECRHNCCRGAWDIEVDDEAMENFKKIEGEFGERVRASVSADNVFTRIDGHCPLLTDNGMCEIVLHGEKQCRICDEYPRFTEFYDEYTERGISLSCEAAADIILNNKHKVRLIGDTGDCDEDIFVFINKARNNIFEILQNRQTDIFSRLRHALDYCAAVQKRINENNYDEFSYIPKYSDREGKDLRAYIDVLKNLEILTPTWGYMLDAVYKRESEQGAHSADDVQAEQLAVYFVYRYFLKAAFDCDVFSKMKFAALSVMMIVALENTFGNIAECARLYSVEIEHSDDNIDAIYDEFLFCEELSAENILDMMR